MKSSSSEDGLQTHGNATSLFGNTIPVGRRTPMKRTPRCPPKPSLSSKTSEQRDAMEASSSVRKKSSKYKGVTKHRVTQRYEAHLWDKSAYNAKQKKKGRQVYLGAYDEEKAAARAYDLAALKYWGPSTVINFKLEHYIQELKEMEQISKEEYLTTLRRKSNGFSRGISKYRGVARHHHNGRWEARIGRVEGNKYLYLGTFGTQEEAAEAYDRAAIHYRKAAAVTNFELSRYPDLCHLYQNVPAKKGPKNKIIIKNCPKDNQTAEGVGSSSEMKVVENENQTADGGGHISITFTNLSDGGMNLTCPQDSLKFPSDFEMAVVELPKHVPSPTLEARGLNNNVPKKVKQEDFSSVPKNISQPDYFEDLGAEYDDILSCFNVFNDMSYTFD
ncbi:hypothetical protein M758_1G184300 [Ceratodon purpureus]|nr:hypothetical protein M758_1G184300 [Ceratodon purpureus]